MDIINQINFNNTSFQSAVESIKYIIIVPVFLFWSLYDLLTKTIRVKWQKTLIAFGMLYNFVYLFIDKNIVNDNLTGFIICFLITYLYSLLKKVLGLGEFGKGDVMYCGIIGLLFGTAVGILTIILSFAIFDGLLRLIKKVAKRTKSISVAFFPFITCALFIIFFLIGESNVRQGYNCLFDMLNITTKYVSFF